MAVSLFIGALTGITLISYRYLGMLKQLYIIGLEESYDWETKILPLVCKYAISWASGYFMLYIFTLVAFHYYGTIKAGKVRLSTTVCLAIFGIANI